MLTKALAVIIAIVALATGTAVAVTALAFALYAALAPGLGEAGAAAMVAVVLIVVILLIAVLAALAGKPRRRKDDDGLIERIMEIARDKPMLAVGAAVAAGILAIRNPALVATVVAAFMDRPKDKR